MSTALDNTGHNCNLAVQAESLMMAKEHLVETLRQLRYTIGTGCSGGSLAQQWIANAYPGIYQGIMPTCSYPDAWRPARSSPTTTCCSTTSRTRRSGAPGVAWTPTQMANVQGHISIANSQVSEAAQFHVVIPTDPCLH